MTKIRITKEQIEGLKDYFEMYGCDAMEFDRETFNESIANFGVSYSLLVFAKTNHYYGSLLQMLSHCGCFLTYDQKLDIAKRVVAANHEEQIKN